MRTVVTGAAGHIGANLVRTLVQRGDSVRAVVHVDRTALTGLDLELVYGDVADVATLRQAFEGADIVYHLAGHISISRDSRPQLAAVNVEGAQNVVQACRDCGVRRLVHFSSIHDVVSPPDGAVVDETTPLAKTDECPHYDRSKALGERIVMDAAQQGLDAIVLAPTAVVGPHDYRPSYFGRVLLSLARRQIPVLVCGGYDWVDVRDVVAATLRATDSAPAGSKYMLSGHWHSIMDVARAAGDMLGCSVPRVVAPLSLARACGPLAESICRIIGRTPLYTRYSVDALSSHRFVSHQKATRELGYEPRPFQQTLYDTYLWFEQQGSLPAGVWCGADPT